MVDSASVPAMARPVVVLVDDDAAVLASLKFALEMEGLSVEAFLNPADLLARPGSANADCLILDYYLPDTNGLELLEKLRKKGVAAPAIIITTNPGPWLRRHAKAEGAAIVEKPLLGNSLLEAIRASLPNWSQ